MPTHATPCLKARQKRIQRVLHPCHPQTTNNTPQEPPHGGNHPHPAPHPDSQQLTPKLTRVSSPSNSLPHPTQTLTHTCAQTPRRSPYRASSIQPRINSRARALTPGAHNTPSPHKNPTQKSLELPPSFFAKTLRRGGLRVVWGVYPGVFVKWWLAFLGVVLVSFLCLVMGLLCVFLFRFVCGYVGYGLLLVW